MSTSGSDNFVATRNQIVDDALMNVGAVGPARTPSGAQREHASRLLNDLVKSIDADGQFLWRVTRSTITTTAATANYSLSATVLDVDQPMRFLEAGSSSATIIQSMTRDEYMALADRTTSARAPTLYYAQKDLASDGRVQITVYFWPVPSTSNDTIEYAGFTRGEDFDISTDNPDFPQAWIHCLKLGLSASLAPAYGDRQLGQYYEKLFEIEKAKQLNNDNERGDAYLVPFGINGNYSDSGYY